MTTHDLERIMQVPVKDNGEALVKVEGIKTYVDAKHYLLFNDGEQYVRQGVAERLLEAQKRLPEGLDLLVLDGYRTAYQQQKRHDDHLAELKAQYFALPEEQHVKDADAYTAKMVGHAPHTTGGAVNVTLMKEGREVFMGGFYESIDARTPTASTFMVDEKEQDYRNILLEAMTSVGFVNNPEKWWHYSYGDQAWAKASGAQEAIYGTTKHPDER